MKRPAIHRQNAWATVRLLEFVSDLDPSVQQATAVGTWGPLLGTLTHLVAADERYLALLTGRTHDQPVSEGAPVDAQLLLDHARWLDRQWNQVFEEAAPEWFYGDVEVEDGGERYLVQRTVVLTQGVNHGTEHRAEVKVILTQSGVEPPSLDGWTFGDADGAIRRIETAPTG
ncbi:MAG: DinB family protein [Candidatus Dormibacteria bacterium]